MCGRLKCDFGELVLTFVRQIPFFWDTRTFCEFRCIVHLCGRAECIKSKVYQNPRSQKKMIKNIFLSWRKIFRKKKVYFLCWKKWKFSKCRQKCRILQRKPCYRFLKILIFGFFNKKITTFANFAWKKKIFCPDFFLLLGMSFLYLLLMFLACFEQSNGAKNMPDQKNCSHGRDPVGFQSPVLWTVS